MALLSCNTSHTHPSPALFLGCCYAHSALYSKVSGSPSYSPSIFSIPVEKALWSSLHLIIVCYEQTQFIEEAWGAGKLSCEREAAQGSTHLSKGLMTQRIPKNNPAQQTPTTHTRTFTHSINHYCDRSAAWRKSPHSSFLFFPIQGCWWDLSLGFAPAEFVLMKRTQYLHH